MGRQKSTGVLPAEQQQSLQRLYSAVADMAQSGHRVPCTGQHSKAWTSDDDEVQTYAAAHCIGCPIISQCREHITAWPEKHSVWAGLKPNERN